MAPTPNARPAGSDALTLLIPAAVVEAIATRVVELLDERAAISSAGPASPYLTVDEAAGVLRVARQGVYDRVASGALVPLRDGRRLLFHRDQISSYIEGRA